MAFKFYIDGQLTDQPVNDTALVTNIKRDSTLGALLITQDVELVYNGNNDPPAGTISGYTYLLNKFNSGTCNEIEIEIYDQIDFSNTVRIYTGVIKVPEITIDLHRALISSKIQDNSFYAYVSNNKNVEYNLISDKSKNKVDVTAPDIYDVDLFQSQTGIYGSIFGNLFKGYRVYDAFRFLVAAISDNKVTFESFYLRNEPELFIFDGAALVTPNSSPNVNVSFEKLYTEVRKLKNCTFWIDTTDPDNPVLRLEDKTTTFSGVQVLEFTDILNLTASIKPDQLYGSVRVGSDYNPGGSDPIYTWNAGTSYYGWKEEVYTPQGQCNTDNELNLVNEYIIASNAINDQIMGVVDSNLDSIFLVECDTIDTVNFTAVAVAYDFFGAAPPYFYNQGLNNVNKLQINGSNFQTSVTNSQDVGGNGFKASLGQDFLALSSDPNAASYNAFSVQPVIFSDELNGDNYDGNGNYDNLTGIYTAPLPGDYSFKASFNFDINSLKECVGSTVTILSAPSGIPTGTFVGVSVYFGVVLKAIIRIYDDATLTTLISQSTQQLGTIVNGSYTLNVSALAQMTAGQVGIVRYEGKIYRYAPSITIYPLSADFGIIATVTNCPPSQPYIEVVALEDSYFECNGTPDGGITITANDPSLYKDNLWTFNYEINQTDWLQVVANPIGMFMFEKDGIERLGWIQEMQHNDWTGQTQIKLITQNATT